MEKKKIDKENNCCSMGEVPLWEQGEEVRRKDGNVEMEEGRCLNTGL